MAHHDRSILPAPSPEQRRAAVGQFERANQVIATGDHDYGIQLLLSCCKLDPANLIYRQLLRRTEKAKYRNNQRGGWFSRLTAWPTKAKLKAAVSARDHLKVLEHGEELLARNPWDVNIQIAMARAAEVLGLYDLAVWILEEARRNGPRERAVNRELALLYERLGNFIQAISLWDTLHRADKDDEEASRKVKELSARETIARGHYGKTADTEAQEEEETPEGEEPETSSELPRVMDPVALPLQMRIQADPTDWHAYLQLSAFFRRNGNLESARQVLEQGLGPTSNRFELMMDLADLEIEPFRRNMAITEDKLKANPTDEELRKIRVRLLKEINTRELDLYRQKVDRQPSELVHRFELGLRLLRAGQADEAIKELQLAREDMRLRWKSLLYLGYCFKSRNHWRLAQRNFEEALEHLPANETPARKEILFQIAYGSADAGDLATAVEMGMELANLDFSYRDIGRLLDEWQTRVQDADITP